MVTYPKLIILMIMSACLIASAHAGSNGTIILSGEELEAKTSADYLNAQWDVSNFTVSGNQSKFWITNFQADGIPLTEINLRNHDTYEQITYSYIKKTTLDGNETASIWNLFGLLNPDSKLSKGEKCQIVFEGAVKNLDIDYKNVRKTHWGDV